MNEPEDVIAQMQSDAAEDIGKVGKSSDITDEELAKLELRFMHVDHVSRLIAALRASREELQAVMVTGTELITELSRDLRASRAEAAYFTNSADLATTEAARLGDENARLRAEVERLRSFLSDADRRQYEAEVIADWKAQQ